MWGSPMERKQDIYLHLKKLGIWRTLIHWCQWGSGLYVWCHIWPQVQDQDVNFVCSCSKNYITTQHICTYIIRACCSFVHCVYVMYCLFMYFVKYEFMSTLNIFGIWTGWIKQGISGRHIGLCEITMAISPPFPDINDSSRKSADYSLMKII